MKKWISLYLIMISSLAAYNQNTVGLPQIINFHNNDFRGGAQTWDMKQDEAGRMYFANNEGLLTFDGTYWKLYPQPNKTILRSIALEKGRVYAGGQDELGFFEPDSLGRLRYTSLKTLIPEKYRSFTDVWEIEIYNNSVFFRTWDHIFEYRNEAISTYPAQTGWHILKKAGNRLIAQDKYKGLFEYSNHQWLPLRIQMGFEITGIVETGRDSLLISSLENGLFLYHGGSLKPWPTDVDQDLYRSHIYSLEQINKNEIVVGTTSKGCIIINLDGEMVQQIARPEGLQNNNVLSVFLDRNNNLWTGLDNGISFVAYNSAIKYIKPGKEELMGYSVKIFRNQLYIATSDGAFVAPVSSAAKDLSFSRGDFSRIENSSGQNWRLDEVNGELLLGHHNGSFLIKDNRVQQLSKDAGAWIFVPTSAVAPASRILTGTYSGLLMLGYEKGRFSNLGEIKGLYESLRFLTMDNNQTIWASHPYRGVYRIHLSGDGKSYRYDLFTSQHGLPSTLRNNVFRIRNRVVFATEKGIYEFDEVSGRFIPSRQLYQVFGNTNIQYLMEDQEGNIWFCENKKIGVVSIDEKGKHQITYFPELTGKILSGFEYIYPYNQENIFIASNSGIIHLNYRKYISSPSSPGILLAQVKLSPRDSVIFGGYFEGLAEAKQSSAHVVHHFTSRNNSFQFEFSSPGFDLQNSIVYSYRLKGYEKDWSLPSIKTEKEYTNLPDGNYVFEVKAIDNLGNESAALSYEFVILPPWYKTIWAYCIYLVLLVAAVYLLHRWQKKKMWRQQSRFEEEQRRLKYIHQLEMEKNEKEIIKLQNEKLISEMVYKNKELADVSMHLMERSDALIKVKDELQQLHKKTGGNHDVKRAIQLVNEIEKNNTNWEQFAAHFDEINNDFIKKLKTQYPNLTITDLKVCTYLQLKLASKEIAQLMNISVRGVEISRYRLRKKLNLSKGQTLNDFLIAIHEGKNLEAELKQ